MIAFKDRSEEDELMDDMSLDENQLEAILADINKANTLLGGNRITLKAIHRLIRKFPQKSYRIVDMGCGDGSMLREVAAFCSKLGIEAEFIGIDLNEKSIQIAKKRGSSYSEVSYLKRDILALNEEELKCDILLCTLTLHHFQDKEIVKFINKFAELAHIGVIINDLERNKIAYHLFKVFSAVFMKTDIARNDGLISIKSGFNKKELLSFSGLLPEMRHLIRRRWVFRYEWTFWHPNNLINE
ncbi:methyltransferase domain-containing protein [Muriicola soli]|uniref:Methyltransferase domain-containing protein n=1 Tax=Muriicola soli TaxID=2507538 RepID=A0A411E9J7_9FLAO|nr:methyltransferase domain-containing protein [Muriicola soli]QBA64130.1 methyltransferase domain-containing protein [Muriicola soli]